jgi:hypothetical protein
MNDIQVSSPAKVQLSPAQGAILQIVTNIDETFIA